MRRFYLCRRMGRILGIDYGKKRTGLSVTDAERIIVSGLSTVETTAILTFLKEYFKKEVVDEIVIGYPFEEGAFGEKGFKRELDEFIHTVRKTFSTIPVKLQDERYSSRQAREILFASGKKKKTRENKALLDQTSAILILQEYLGHI